MNSRPLPPLAPPGRAACIPLADLFTASNLDAHTLRQMRAVCARCPIAAACQQEATSTPVHGFYAGRYYGERRRLRQLAQQRSTAA